jgi:hypothetical protein
VRVPEREVSLQDLRDREAPHPEEVEERVRLPAGDDVVTGHEQHVRECREAQQAEAQHDEGGDGRS